MLPERCTIRDLLDEGKLSENYVRDIWKNCLTFKKLNGDFHVRIGLTGKGAAPNYRIEFANPPKEQPTSEQARDHFAGRSSHPAIEFLTANNTAFSGRSHKKAMNALDHEKWSSQVSTSADIEQILKDFVNQRKA